MAKKPEESCELLGVFGIAVQLFMGLCVISSLLGNKEGLRSEKEVRKTLENLACFLP